MSWLPCHIKDTTNQALIGRGVHVRNRESGGGGGGGAGGRGGTFRLPLLLRQQTPLPKNRLGRRLGEHYGPFLLYNKITVQ